MGNSQWPCNRNRLVGGTYHVNPIFKDYVREYPHKILPHTVQYLNFRILKFPLKWWINWNRMGIFHGTYNIPTGLQQRCEKSLYIATGVTQIGWDTTRNPQVSHIKLTPFADPHSIPLYLYIGHLNLQFCR